MSLGSGRTEEVDSGDLHVYCVAEGVSRFVGCHRHLHPVRQKFFHLKTGASHLLFGDAKFGEVTACLRVGRYINPHLAPAARRCLDARFPQDSAIGCQHLNTRGERTRHNVLRSPHDAGEFHRFSRPIHTAARPEKRFIAMFQIRRPGDVEIGGGVLMPVQLDKPQVIAFRDGNQKRHKAFRLLRDLGKLDKACPVRFAGEQRLVIIADECNAGIGNSIVSFNGFHPDIERVADALGENTHVGNQHPLVCTHPSIVRIAHDDFENPPVFGKHLAEGEGCHHLFVDSRVHCKDSLMHGGAEVAGTPATPRLNLCEINEVIRENLLNLHF